MKVKVLCVLHFFNGRWYELKPVHSKLEILNYNIPSSQFSYLFLLYH